MSEIEEWAKREAEREFPGREPRNRTTDEERWEKPDNRSGMECGILHLAEQLQREDVIEAGAAALDAFNKDIDYYGFDAKKAQEACLAAMLAKIAEGDAS